MAAVQSFQPRDEDIENVMLMGFSRADAVNALKESLGDVDLAVAELLASGKKFAKKTK